MYFGLVSSEMAITSATLTHVEHHHGCTYKLLVKSHAPLRSHFGGKGSCSSGGLLSCNTAAAGGKNTWKVLRVRGPLVNPR